MGKRAANPFRSFADAAPKRNDLNEYNQLVPDRNAHGSVIMRTRVATDDPRLFPLKDASTRNLTWKEARKLEARKAEALGLKKPGCVSKTRHVETAPEVLGDVIVPRVREMSTRWGKRPPRNLGPASNKSWTTGRSIKE